MTDDRITARRAALVRVMTADDRLDDVSRARMWARLEDRIVDAPPRRTYMRYAIAAGAMAVAVASVMLFARSRGHDDTGALVAPRDTTLEARLGPYTRAALVGPARVHVVPGATTRVTIESGTLLGDFEGGSGRALHIAAPGMSIDIVGTLFAVEVRDHATCLSVAHGRVHVQTAFGERFVIGGQRACSTDVITTPIEPAVEHALAQHASILATRETPLAPAPIVTPLPTPAPQIQTPPPPDAEQSKPQPQPKLQPQPKPPKLKSLAKQQPKQRLGDAVASTAPEAKPEPKPELTPAPIEEPKPEPPKPQPPAPAPQPAPPPPVTADSLYHAAELALAKQDAKSADRALAQLITTFPGSSLVDQAHLDRARIAYDRHAWSEARKQLDALASITGSPLAESGRYLSCRIDVEAHDGDAARCLTDFRTTYPHSAHDLDVLGTLAQLAHSEHGCAGARAYVGELARRYPKSKLAAAWQARCKDTP